MKKRTYIKTSCFLICALFFAVFAFADDWDQCVREKKLQYIDDHADDWREAEARAMAYCDIKTPKSAERLSQEAAERELIQSMWKVRQEEERKKKAQTAERKRKELEKKQQEAEKKRLLKSDVGEPFFVTEREFGAESGLGIMQTITIYRDSEEVSRAEYRCKATALIKSKDMWGNVNRESYSEITGTGNVVFGAGKMESTANINWLLFSERIIAITDFNYTCSAKKARESIFDLPL